MTKDKYIWKTKTKIVNKLKVLGAVCMQHNDKDAAAVCRESIKEIENLQRAINLSMEYLRGTTPVEVQTKIFNLARITK